MESKSQSKIKLKCYEYEGKKMKYIHSVAFATIIALSSVGCTNKNYPTSLGVQKPSARQLASFKRTMTKVATSTQYDRRYHRMDLNTKKKKVWFKRLMYQLWNRDITRKTFLSEGHKRYPKHSYEFYFIAKGFQKNS